MADNKFTFGNNGDRRKNYGRRAYDKKSDYDDDLEKFRKIKEEWEKENPYRFPSIPEFPPTVPRWPKWPESPYPSDPNPIMGHCPKCGITLHQIMHYVCNRPNCPVFLQITCDVGSLSCKNKNTT